MNTSLLLLNGGGSAALVGVSIFAWRKRRRLLPKQRLQQILAMMIWGCLLGAAVSILEMGWPIFLPYQDEINIIFDLAITVLAFYYRRPAQGQERLMLTWVLAGGLLLLLTNTLFLFHK